MEKKQKNTISLTVLTLILGLTLSAPTKALDCTSELGGIPFKGANNVDYCVSEITMNSRSGKGSEQATRLQESVLPRATRDRSSILQ